MNDSPMPMENSKPPNTMQKAESVSIIGSSQANK